MAIDMTETAWLLNGVAIVLLALIFALLKYAAANYLLRFVAEIFGKLVGIAVVDIALAMVVKPCVVFQY